MSFRAIVIAALLLTAAPAFAQKIYVGHDPDYDIDGIESFSWSKTLETSAEASDPLMHSHIVNTIEHYLSVGGIREVESDPDVYVTYHTSTTDSLILNVSYFGYGYPAGWGWGGYGYAFPTATVSSFETGTLVVDVWDADTKEMVWRGIATNITVYDNPERMLKKADVALKKIVKKWQRIKKKG
jgi:hypothetical protein